MSLIAECGGRRSSYCTKRPYSHTQLWPVGGRRSMRCTRCFCSARSWPMAAASVPVRSRCRSGNDACSCWVTSKENHCKAVLERGIVPHENHQKRTISTPVPVFPFPYCLCHGVRFYKFGEVNEWPFRDDSLLHSYHFWELSVKGPCCAFVQAIPSIPFSSEGNLVVQNAVLRLGPPVMWVGVL